MALIYCPECGKELSDTLKKCPHCGMKIKNKKEKKVDKKKRGIIIAIIVAVIILVGASAIIYNVLSLSQEEKKQVEEVNNRIVQILDIDIENSNKNQLESKIEECDTAIEECEKTDWKVKLHIKDSDKLNGLKKDCTEQIENINKKAVKEVEDAIDSIGEVTLDSESKIDTANKLYDDLDEEQKEMVTKYDVLQNSTKSLGELKVKKVIGLIDKIGAVKYNDKTKNKIDAAKTAYSNLNYDEKSAVTNYNTLTKAEKEYDKLKDKKEKEDKIAEVKKSISITNCSFEMNSVGGCDIYIYGVNKSNKVIKYIDYELVAFNAVNDILENEIGYHDYTTDLRETGPINPGSSYGRGKYWDAAFYNTTTKYFKIKSVLITYKDGTEQEISGEYVDYICNW